MSFTKVTSAGIGSTELVTLDSLEVINNASIGGVLTYEDVTNVDSIGIITARAGVLVGSGITLSKDGDVFFTGIATGNGSGLTNLPAANLTGTLPAISGANLTNLDASDLASGTVPTARLGSGTASSSTFLRGDSSFQTVDTNLVADTTPQLGGNLDVNTKNIVFGDSSDGSSDDVLSFGASGDLKIFHQADQSRIVESGPSVLKIMGSDVRISNAGNTADYFQGNDGSDVKLFHNGNLKFATTSAGVEVTGTLGAGAANLGTGDLTLTGNINLADSSGGGNNRIIFGTGDDFQLWHDGSHSYIADEGTGNLRILTNSFTVNNAANSENMIQATQDGAVQLYHDSELHLETHANGAQVKNAGADTSLYITAADGYSAQIQLLADNGDDYADLSRIYKDQSGGKLHIQNYAGGSWENNLVCDNNGAVRLYYDNTEYASTLNTGFNVGLKARNSDYNHQTTVGWALSDGWTKVVFNGSVAGNTPFTIYNENASYSRYMWYLKFDGGVMNHQSNNGDLCDERIKQDFGTVSSQWNNIKNIDLKTFRYKDEPSDAKLKIGVTAQQVETIYPDLVEEDWPIGDADPNTHEKNTGDFYKSVKKDQLLMYAVKALQEAQARIETLETKVAALEG